MVEAAWLVVAGVAAGVVSVVASLASLVSYPALLAVGLPPLAANTTNTVALVWTSVGSAMSSREELAGQGRRLVGLCAVAAVGGAVGAGLLLLGPPGSFEVVVPWLVAAASVVILLGPRLRSWLDTAAKRSARRRGDEPGQGSGLGLRVAAGAVTVYTGCFGAAGGVLMLAVLDALLRQPLPRTIAVKNVVSGVANGVAAVGFIAFGPVDWASAVPLGAGFLVGGWLGPHVVRRLPVGPLRVGIALAGLAVAAWLALRS